MKTILSGKELAQRWGIAEGTLANWRSRGIAPKYSKQFNRVVFKIKDVLDYEKKHKIVISN